MAAFDYAYGVRLDSEGSGTAFGTDVDDARIPNETGPPFRVRPVVISNRHGEATPDRLFYASYDFIFEVTLAYGTPNLPATVYSNKSSVTSRLLHHLETVWLQRTAPHQGDVEIPILIRRPPRSGNPPHRFRFSCRTKSPFWRDQALTHNAVNPVSGVTNGGDAPIADGVFVLSGGTNQVLTHTATGSTITIVGSSTPAVTIDQSGTAITVKQSGSHADGLAQMGDPWGIELQPGSNAFTLTGGGSATFSGRDKWL